MPQLTLRAVVTGMLLGGVMAITNLYVGMKTGWGLGVTITACILAFAMFSSLQRVVPSLRKNEFTILENNMMSSAASAAGYMSSSIFVSAVPALWLTSQETVGWFALSLWAAAVSFLGVFMAIPMKRQQINRRSAAVPERHRNRRNAARPPHAGRRRQPEIDRAGGERRGGWDRRMVLREAHARWMPFNLPSVWTPKTFDCRSAIRAADARRRAQPDHDRRWRDHRAARRRLDAGLRESSATRCSVPGC